MTIEEWAKDFKSYVNGLTIFRDDYDGIMEYIDDAISLMEEQEARIKKFELEKSWDESPDMMGKW